MFLRARPTPGIRSRLVWLAAACIAPALLMAGALLYLYYEREQSHLTNDSAASARAISYAVDRELFSIETALLALAGSPSLQAKNLTAFDLQARDIVRDRRISNIVLCDLNAQQLINTRQPIGTPLPLPLPLHGNPELVQSVIAAGMPVISDLFTGRLAQRPLISIGVPVKQGNKVAYVLTGTIEPARFAEILAQQQLAADKVAEVLDRSGAVVAGNRELQNRVGHKAPTPLLEELRQSGEGLLKTVNLEGQATLMVFSRSRVSGWSAYVALPRADLMRELWPAVWPLMVATTLLLLVALGMAWAVGGQITRAILALGAPALALGEGKALVVPALPIREVDELGKAITRASEMLSSAHAARSRSEARMRGIVESAMDAIVTVDDRQIIVLFNPAACAMFDCSVEEAVGLPITRFIPGRFHDRHAAYIRRRRAHRDSLGVAVDAVGLRRKAEEFPVEVSYSNVVESGAVFHTLIIRDVTARARAREALERSNLDLQRFAYVASHDLKTPLRSISGFVQVLERNHADKLDEKAVELIRRTSDAAHRLEHLTDDLLSYARLNAEIKPFARVNCRDVAHDVSQLLDAAIRTTGAVVTVGDLPCVMGDRTQLVQLFLNLVGNGIKYCRGHAPAVHLSARKDDSEWVFSVMDNGIGIDAKHYDRIFEIFKRLHTQKEYPGTGIGLAVCRRVIERHGGRIWIKSALGEGSTFCFTIPDTLSESIPS